MKRLKVNTNRIAEKRINSFTFHVHLEGTAVVSITRLVSSHIIDKDLSNIEMCSRILVVFNNWCFIRIVQEFRDGPRHTYRLFSCYDQLVFRAWCKVRRFVICWANAMLERHRSLSYYTITLRARDFFEMIASSV